MKKILIILILQTFLMGAQSGIKKVKLYSFDNLIKIIGLEKDTLIVFDIDGVILCSEDKYLSHGNREERHKFLNDIKESYGLERKKDIFGLIISQMGYKLIDPNLVKYFWFLKFHGSDIIALTSMGPNNPYFDQEQDRVDTLKDKGFLFDERYQGTIKIDEQDRPQPKAIEGVIFARGYEKGLVLKAYLDQQKANYRKVVVIDDMSKNLDSIEEYCKDNIDDITLIEYKYDESAEQKPIEEVSRLQKYFITSHSIWLSDKQAITLLQIKDRIKVK